MKRSVFIATLAIFALVAGRALADKGPGGGDQPQPLFPSATVHQEGSIQSGDDNQKPRPEDAPGLDRQNRGEGKGLFGLFRKDTPPLPPQPGQKDMLDSFKQQRDDLQQERKDELGNLKENRATLEAAIKAKRDELKAKIEEVKKEKPTQRKEFVETRFTDAISNLHTIADRLQAKADELSSKNYDMTDASTAITAATTSLKAAEDAFATLKAATVTDTSDTSVVKPREIAQKVEGLLKETRDHFHEAIDAMKTAVGAPTDDDLQEDDASTTTSQQ